MGCPDSKGEERLAVRDVLEGGKDDLLEHRYLVRSRQDRSES